MIIRKHQSLIKYFFAYSRRRAGSVSEISKSLFNIIANHNDKDHTLHKAFGNHYSINNLI